MLLHSNISNKISIGNNAASKERKRNRPPAEHFPLMGTIHQALPSSERSDAMTAETIEMPPEAVAAPPGRS